MRLQLIRGVAVTALILGGIPTSHAEERAPDGARLVTRAGARTSVYADTTDVTVVTPVATAEVGSPTQGWQVRGQYLVDVVSAASVDIVSTASQRWTEVRHAGALGASYERGGVGLRPQGSFSVEPDYVSFAGGAVVSAELPGRSHTAFVGGSHSHDTIGRTGTSFDVFSRTLDADTIGAGVTLTLNRSTHLSLAPEVVFERGDSSKPYRYIPIFDASVAPGIQKGASIDRVNRERISARPLEQLPLDRQRFALTARVGHRFGRSTIRVDERVYTDSWSVKASTTEARYFVDLSRRLRVWPRARVHAQTAAAFWQRAYTGTLAGDGLWVLPRLRTGDRELSPLITAGAGAGASFAFGPRTHPSLLTAVTQIDVMHTEFLDTLYLTSRDALLATLGVEGDFE